MPTLKLFSPSDFPNANGDFPALENYNKKFLAMGDSWFSEGAVPAFLTTNMLCGLQLQQSAFAINCAQPGLTMKLMVDSIRNREFISLLTGARRWRWDGILFSGGGDDLIAAVGVLPTYADGPNKDQSVPKSGRILLRSDEWTQVTSADKYLSNEGWEVFSDRLRQCYATLDQLRAASENPLAPIITHCYAYLMPRDAPTAPRIGPWLLPAVRAYNIPSDDWGAIGETLIVRLKTLLQSINIPRLYAADTTPAIAAASLGSHGSNGDWENEIHPTAQGYKKLSAIFAKEIDART